MVRRNLRVLILLLLVAALCGPLSAQGPLPAQTDNTMIVRLLDSRTGHLIATSDFLVRINHEETVHGNWVLQNEDGTGKLTVPQNAAILSAQAKYNSNMSVYINCDTVKDKGTQPARWYAVSDILTAGVVAPNGCSKRTAVAKPGEFVLFVREQNWKEIWKDYTD